VDALKMVHAQTLFLSPFTSIPAGAPLRSGCPQLNTTQWLISQPRLLSSQRTHFSRQSWTQL
jgi:hypothetical protein